MINIFNHTGNFNACEIMIMQSHEKAEYILKKIIDNIQNHNQIELNYNIEDILEEDKQWLQQELKKYCREHSIDIRL